MNHLYLTTMMTVILLMGMGSVANAQGNRASSTQPKQETTMTRPKVIIFDVNETLLSLAPLKTSVGKALGGREELLPLWFSTMLRWSRP